MTSAENHQPRVKPGPANVGDGAKQHWMVFPLHQPAKGRDDWACLVSDPWV
jgi:hypothetical protein